MNPYKAILLVGPTASGKTPLGDYMEKKKFRGTRCVHFDFGANLRQIAHEGDAGKLLSDEDVTTVIYALKSGALLEDENFHIAKDILLSFARRRHVKEGDFIVLNGLPRHVGQATAIEELVDIQTVICLQCATWAIAERIRRDSGGDRGERLDDTPSEIACKLRVYEKRTIPLLDHYRRKGVSVIDVKIKPDTTPENIVAELK